MGVTVHFETLGCRLNQDETEGAARSFFDEGYECSLEGLLSSSDVDEGVLLCVINTCTVTSKAEQKARRLIRLSLQKFPMALVCVTGCYAELDGASIENINKSRIFIIPGTKKFFLKNLAKNFKTFLTEKKLLDIQKVKAFIKTSNEKTSNEKTSVKKDLPLSPAKKADVPLAFTLYTSVFKNHSRASVKIQDGCNNSCTFCRIHLARGTSVSLPVNEVLLRVKELESSGKKEVVFTGVNLSQYAGDFEEDGVVVKKDFAFLLDFLLKNTSKIKFRISSFYPQSVTKNLCAVLKNDRVQPFFHLSVQSASDAVLKAMKRPYGYDDIVRAVKAIRSAKSGCFISCDIIAGFPGESEDDFLKTVSLCKECSFSWMHVFPFSPRPGTEAALMKGQILDRIKNERAKVLNQIAVQSKIDYIRSMRKKTFSAIIENSRAIRRSLKNECDKDFIKTYHAVTDNFIHVEIKTPCELKTGDEVSVIIEEELAENIKAGKEIECRASLV